jgi:hypothetical protein
MKCSLVRVKGLWLAFFEMVKRCVNLFCAIIFNQDSPSASPSPSPGLAPTLSSIYRADGRGPAGEQESTVPIALIGTNFTPEITIYIDGWTGVGLATTLGLTVTNLVVVSSTTITCDFVISQTAPIGLRNVVVSHTGGLSEYGAVQYRVGYPPASANSTVSASVSPSASVSASVSASYSPSASISPSASLSASPSS